MSGCTADFSRLPKDISIALQFLQEVIRSDKTEMLLGSSNAVFDAVLVLIEALRNKSPKIEDAFECLMDWMEKKVIDPDSEEFPYSKDEGIRLAVALQKELLEHNDQSNMIVVRLQQTSQNSHHKYKHQSISSMICTNLKGECTSNAKSTSNQNADTTNNRPVQTLEELIEQLNLRQIEKFEPVFPIVEPDDSDDDDSNFIIDERREEREEKKDTKTYEEEIQRLPDGREIHSKKTKTYNLQQISKNVTISSREKGRKPVIMKFQDDNVNCNDDFETDFFTISLSKIQRNPFGDLHSGFGDAFDSPRSSHNETTWHKIKTLQHSGEVSQTVAKTAKRNGITICNSTAQMLDTNELNAGEIETYMGDKLLFRQGSGSYDVQSFSKIGLPNSTNPPPVPPKRRHVVQYIQTFGNEKELTKDEFFKGSTLASYIVLNDSLRYEEEQYRKKSKYAYRLPGHVPPGPEFSNLNHLLQHSEVDRILFPTRSDISEQISDQGSLCLLERKAVTDTTSVIESLDASDWLVLRAQDGNSKPNEVRGGPKDALIAYATQPSGIPLFQEAFLTTYRTFVESIELIQKLVRRYLFMYLSSDQASKKIARQSFSVLVRVVDELCSIELNREVVRAVTSFVYLLIRDGNYAFAKLLRSRLMCKIEQKCGYTKNSILHDISLNSADYRPALLFEVRSSLIAKQMTLLDSDLFQKIETPEMLWWAQDQDEKKSPNLCIFTEHFNKVSYWVRTLVIRPNDQRMREKYLMKFVKIMKQLRIMGNYNSYLAILSALDSGPIRRLDWSKGIQDMLREHSSVMDSSHSFRNYRNLLAERKPPCLPYIGLVLQDLTFVHVGNSDYLSPHLCHRQNHLLNYGKRWQQFAILDSIRRFKRWNYSIERDDRVLQFFGGFKNYLCEDDVWELSEKIKPRVTKGK